MEQQDIVPCISDDDDDNYAEELQLQQTLMDSLITSNSHSQNAPCLASSSKPVDVGLVYNTEQKRSLLPKELIDKWNDSLCESLFITVPKFYCPFKDCSAMLLDENEGGGEEEYIRESECPFCHRLFCARCHVPWHPG
ncbi:putative E3 ubiquitin-protein ligase RNF144A-like protein, partial [Trifolium pratense]